MSAMPMTCRVDVCPLPAARFVQVQGQAWLRGGVRNHVEVRAFAFHAFMSNVVGGVIHGEHGAL